MSMPVASSGNTSTSKTYTSTLDGDASQTLTTSFIIPTPPTDTLGTEVVPGLWIGSPGFTTSQDPNTGDITLSGTVFIAPQTTGSQAHAQASGEQTHALTGAEAGEPVPAHESCSAPPTR